MKKLILLPSIMLVLGVFFTSCKDNTEREENVTEVDEIGTEETGMDEIAYSEFSQYDSNRDGLYDRNEFGESYDSEFPKLDTDGDGSLNKDEFYVSTFRTVDEDRNDSVSKDEWNSAKDGILNDRAGDKEFSEFDANNDEQITREEWKKSFEQSDWFVSYDTNKDNLIQQEEWDNGFFDDWDLDNDGSLNEEEFNNFSPQEEQKDEMSQKEQEK